MELSNAYISNPEVHQALKQLLSTKFDPKTSYNLRRIDYLCEKQFKALRKEFQELVKQHAVLDEKGNVVNSEDGMPKIKEDLQTEYSQKKEELLTKSFTLERCEKVNWDWIKHAPNLQISSEDLRMLEPILDGLDLG